MSYSPPPPPPGQPYQGSPQPGYQPPAPAKRKKWPFVVGGLVLLMVLCIGGAIALLGKGASEVGNALEEADQNQKGQNAVGGVMGKPTTDGKFAFTVTGMKCGAKSVGPKEFGDKAQGEFCLVDVTIKNVGKDAELFNDSSQKAYDAKGQEFSVDSGAAIYANGDSSTFLEDINPGNQVKGKLVFDVPPGTKLAHVVLHESMMTPGVKVPLK
jgi:hypothetical protein